MRWAKIKKAILEPQVAFRRISAPQGHTRLQEALMKAVREDNQPPEEKHVRRILEAPDKVHSNTRLRSPVSCKDVAEYIVADLFKTLRTPASWQVALKALIVIHRCTIHRCTWAGAGSTYCSYCPGQGTAVLNILLELEHRGDTLLEAFRQGRLLEGEDSVCGQWVCSYAAFLDEMLRFLNAVPGAPEAPGAAVGEGSSPLDQGRRLLDQAPHMQALLQCGLACVPPPTPSHEQVVAEASRMAMKDSCTMFRAICEGLDRILSVFYDMSHADACLAVEICRRHQAMLPDLSHLGDVNSIRRVHVSCDASFLAGMERDIARRTLELHLERPQDSAAREPVSERAPRGSGGARGGRGRGLLPAGPGPAPAGPGPPHAGPPPAGVPHLEAPQDSAALAEPPLCDAPATAALSSSPDPAPARELAADVAAQGPASPSPAGPEAAGSPGRDTSHPYWQIQKLLDLLKQLEGRPAPPLEFSYAFIHEATQEFQELARIPGSHSMYQGIICHPDYDGRSIASRGTFMWVAVRNREQAAELGGPAGLRPRDQLENEIEFLSQCRHPNLVQLLGSSQDGPATCLVFEYMSGECLESRIDLRSELHEPLGWLQRVLIAFDISRALGYLHTIACPARFHRDVSSANVLLDANNRAKLGDSGLGRHNNVAPSDDTYRFGVVCAELLTGERGTYAELRARWEAGDVSSLLDARAGTRDTTTNQVLRDLTDLVMRGCTEQRPELRLGMLEVQQMLHCLALRCGALLPPAAGPAAATAASPAWVGQPPPNSAPNGADAREDVSQPPSSPLALPSSFAPIPPTPFPSFPSSLSPLPSSSPAPDSFLCPITHQVMEDPVMLLHDGHSYERASIERWLQHHDTSPLTNQKLASTELVRNHTLRRAIAEWLQPNAPPASSPSWACQAPGVCASQCLIRC